MVPCQPAFQHFFFFDYFIVLPGQLKGLLLILLTFFLLICQMYQGEAKEIVQRLNYSIVFKPEIGMFMAQEDLLHTFQIPNPRRLGAPNIRFCHRDNDTCFLINQALLQIMVIRTETALRINNTVNTIRKLVPKTKVDKSRSAGSLLPFIGHLSKSLFGPRGGGGYSDIFAHT